jgi:hypothetical protein
MQIVESSTGRPVVRRTLLAAGLGAGIGLQAWRLAIVFAAPRFGAVWVWLGHIFLGASIGLTAELASWWKRGIGLGVAFGLVSSLGSWMVGAKGLPFGLAAMAASLISGLVVALSTDAALPVPLREKAKAVNDGRTFALQDLAAEPRIRTPLGQRLAKKKLALEALERERLRRRKPAFGKTTEERIIWSELLELELQEIDDSLHRLSHRLNRLPPPL